MEVSKFIRKSFNIIPILWEDHRINYDELRKIAKVETKLIAGASAYPRIIDFKIFKDIADEVGAYLLVDMAHIAGLVAAACIRIQCHMLIL